VSNLSYRFRDPSLLDLALTHASTGHQENNERLEFLGDAVLDVIVAEELFRGDEQRSEGEMTELKAWIVSREVLAGVAHTLALEDLARFGHGMRDRRIPRSVLANLYEAYLGAIYLDGGLEEARRFALATLEDAFQRAGQLEDARNPKQELQRRSQIATGEPPNYVLVDERGHAHAKAFLVAAQVGERRFPPAWGRTRKEAERWAAQEALLLLDGEPEA